MSGIFQNGIWTCGFDMKPTAAQIFTFTSSGNSNGSAVTTNTPYGFGYSWTINNQPTWIILNTTLTTIYVGAFMYFTAFSSSTNYLFSFGDTSANPAYQAQLAVTTSGALQFYRGQLSSTIGSPSPAGTITTGAWYYIEARVTIGTSTGEVQCNVNGVPVISLTTGLATNPTGTGYTNLFGFNSVSATNTFIDDWYMLDSTGSSPLNTFLGPVQCRGQVPNNNSAVGGRNAWTPTNPTNINYTNVGNIPISASEYNADSTVGDYDMFRFTTLPATTVFAVNEWVVVGLDSAGTRTVSLDCYSAGTDNLGTAFNPSTIGSPTYYNLMSVVDPNTGVAWTVSGAQAAELGLKVIS